jgi:hypothetical protein
VDFVGDGLREEVVCDHFHGCENLGQGIEFVRVAILDQLEALLIRDTGIVEADCKVPVSGPKL